MRRALPAFLLYCLITLALTYPLALNLATSFPHDSGDPALNTWILWWNAHAIPLTSTWWNAQAFYPVPGVLSFSETLLGLSLIATPIQWLGGSPLLAYNVVFLLTFPLCALGAYLLVLEITRHRDAAFIAGLLFGFAPYRMAHLAHLQVLAAFGMPFALLGLHRYLREPRPRWLALFGAGWLIQALCNGYYLLFFTVLVFIWVLWFAPPTSNRRAFLAIFATGVLVALPVVPLLWRYRAIHETFGFARDLGTTRIYSADVLALFNAEPMMTVWGWVQLFSGPEGQLFPGLTVLLLLAAFVWIVPRDAAAPMPGDARAERRRRSVWRVLYVLGTICVLGALAMLVAQRWGWSFDPVVPLTAALTIGILRVLTSERVTRAHAQRSVLGFYAVAALIMWLFSLGPAPTVTGEPLMYRGPYWLLMHLPGFSALRVPARFWMMSTLCLAVLGAIVFHRTASRFPDARRVLAGIVVFTCLADAWVWPFPLVALPRSWSAQVCIPAGSGAVMELPLGDVESDVRAMYRSMSHGRPSVNGYSGYFPPHYGALRFGLQARDRDVLTRMAAHGVEYVVIDRAHRQERAYRTYIARQPGVEPVCVLDTHTVFRFHGGAKTAAISVPGTPLPVSALDANVREARVGLMRDGDLKTRWDTGPQETGMRLEVDLGEPRIVSAIELGLGQFSEDFPRGLSIEASEDRAVWHEVWRGSSAGLAIAGALQNLSLVPLTYELPSVRARYLRMSLTENDDTFYWSIAEMRVLGQ